MNPPCPRCSRLLPSPEARGCPACGWAAPPPEFKPSPDQRSAWDHIESGRNVFVTGPGGTGKTCLIERWLREGSAKSKNVAVCASTGIAASHLGGRTIHSWMGMGLGNRPAEEFATSPNMDWWRFRIAPRIRAVDVIVVDEISQVNGMTLALFSDLCKLARGPVGAFTAKQRALGEQRAKLPFGGVQVVFVGDMGQLPPVEQETGFPFETSEWWDADIASAELSTVHRQQDAAFVATLNQCRHGVLGGDGIAMLQSRVRAFDPDAEPRAVRVSTHNDHVDSINEARLEELPGDLVAYEAVEEGDQRGMDQLNKNCLSPRILRLKVGARVMFTRNDAGGRWVNGTLGTVTWVAGQVSSGASGHAEDGEGGFEVTTDDGLVAIPERASFQHGDDQIYVPDKWTKKLVRRRAPKEGEAVRIQYPVRLAWAITTHKVQGMTLSRVSVDLSRCFAPGQAYVALSRARSLEGLNIENWNGPASVFAHPTAVSFIRGEYRPPEAYRREREAREQAARPPRGPEPGPSREPGLDPAGSGFLPSGAT